MKVLFAVFCGIIQGLTEFLPVSSSGHLAIFQNIFQMENVETSHLAFDVLLHLGTLIAVFVVYYRDIWQLIVAFFTLLKKLFQGNFKWKNYTEYERFVIFVILATIPLVPIAFLSDYIEVLSSYTKIIGGILIFNGIMLLCCDRIKSEGCAMDKSKPLSALGVGLCQMLAVIPGLSRSGTTITAGRIFGFKREFAVKFSFIMSIPAILGANILNIPDIINNPEGSEMFLPYACGLIAAMISGLIAIKFLLFISKKQKFSIFSIYCFIVGILAIIFG